MHEVGTHAFAVSIQHFIGLLAMVICDQLSSSSNTVPMQMSQVIIAIMGFCISMGLLKMAVEKLQNILSIMVLSVE
jgi:hypothetical protein